MQINQNSLYIKIQESPYTNQSNFNILGEGINHTSPLYYLVRPEVLLYCGICYAIVTYPNRSIYVSDIRVVNLIEFNNDLISSLPKCMLDEFENIVTKALKSPNKDVKLLDNELFGNLLNKVIG